MKVLIVEDEPKTADYLERGLREQGYVVDVARDGLDGKHMALEYEYDVIVLDVMLPGTDGFSVLHALRERRQTPVIMLTTPRWNRLSNSSTSWWMCSRFTIFVTANMWTVSWSWPKSRSIPRHARK